MWPLSFFVVTRVRKTMRFKNDPFLNAFLFPPVFWRFCVNGTTNDYRTIYGLAPETLSCEQGLRKCYLKFYVDILPALQCSLTLSLNIIYS